MGKSLTLAEHVDRVHFHRIAGCDTRQLARGAVLVIFIAIVMSLLNVKLLIESPEISECSGHNHS